MGISVFSSKELQGVIVAMKSFERETAKQIRRVTKAMIEPEWKRAVAENATSLVESRVLVNTARVAISDQNVVLKSATVGRALSGGLKPSDGYAGVEFGGDPQAKKAYTSKSRKGRGYLVTRRTQAMLRPRRRNGYVVYPAAAEVTPRLAALWAQTVVRTFYELIEKK